jgi:toxin CcdB
MARFDVYPGLHGKGYLLDCQADLLSLLPTRVVVPLMPSAGLPLTPRLNPLFNFNGDDHIMMTQEIFALPRQRLARPVANLSAQHHEIVDALDLLFTGI